MKLEEFNKTIEQLIQSSKSSAKDVRFQVSSLASLRTETPSSKSRPVRIKRATESIQNEANVVTPTFDKKS